MGGACPCWLACPLLPRLPANVAVADACASPPSPTAAYLYLNIVDAKARGVQSATARYTLSVIDQRPGGSDHSQRAGLAKEFNEATYNWGSPQLMALADLRNSERAYLARGRLVLRVDIEIPSIERAAAAPAGGA